MNIKPKFGFIVEYVGDIETSKRFYEEVMGLEVHGIIPLLCSLKPSPLPAMSRWRATISRRFIGWWMML